MEAFRPTHAQMFLHERRNCTDVAIDRDLHAQVRQTCAKHVHVVSASVRMLFVSDKLSIRACFHKFGDPKSVLYEYILDPLIAFFTEALFRRC